MTTSDLWHCILTFPRSPTLADPYLPIVAKLVAFGISPGPETGYVVHFFHIDL